MVSVAGGGSLEMPRGVLKVRSILLSLEYTGLILSEPSGTQKNRIISKIIRYKSETMEDNFIATRLVFNVKTDLDVKGARNVSCLLCLEF